MTNIPVGLETIVSILQYGVLDKVPFDLIIGASTLVQMCPRIDMYHQTVKIQKNGVSETLNL